MIHTATISSNFARQARDGILRGLISSQTQESESGRERCVFEMRAYRKAYGVERILRIDTGGAAGSEPLLFEDRGDHAICLARSAALDAREVEAACEALFSSDRIRFVVFEDIDLGGKPNLRQAPVTFRYQSDWVIPLGQEGVGMQPSFRRKVEKNLVRLRKQHDDVSLVIESSPPRRIVEAAIDLSRRKLEASGRTYLIDEGEKERLVGLFGSIGTAAVLLHGDHMVSCELFVEHGLDCYAFIGGYDMDYARFSPGMITMRHAVEHFEARGFRSAHFLWGDGGYKARLGAQAVPLVSMIVPRNARAFVNPGLIAHGTRFGRQHMRERLRERPWLGHPLRQTLEWFRSLKTTLRSRCS